MKKTLNFFLIILFIHSSISSVFAQSFEWAGNFGGATGETSRAITTDTKGNVYVAGDFFTGTADFDPGPGTFNLTSAGNHDAFISKLDSLGNLDWAVNLGGTGGDFTYSIAVDDSGYVYASGVFSEIADFDPGPGVFNLTAVGNGSIFFIKLDSAGSLVWANSIGGIDGALIFSIDLDNESNIYATGNFQGTVDFDPGPAAHNITATGIGSDAYICKFTTHGNFVWAKNWGSLSYGESIKVDKSGFLYSTGFFNNSVDFDPSPGTFFLTSNGGNDVYVNKFDTSGIFIWAKNMGGAIHDRGHGIDIGPLGNIYLTGDFYEGPADFDPGPGTSNLTAVGNVDVFVCKLDSAGNYLWAKGMGGLLGDGATSISVDTMGNVYTAGYFRDTVDFNTGAGIVNLTSAPGKAGTYIHKLDSSGNFDWVKSFGKTYNSVPYSVDTDLTGNLYTTGTFQDTADFHTGGDVYNLAADDGRAFIQKLGLCTSSIDVTVVNSSPTITANANGLFYQWLNCDDFHAPLQNETGQSFTSTNNGSFAVEVDDNGCVDTSNCELIAGIGYLENAFANQIDVFPNPSDGHYSIDLGNTYETIAISITDLNGKVISTENYSQEQIINLTIEEAIGVYFLTVRSGDKKAVIQLIKN